MGARAANLPTKLDIGEHIIIGEDEVEDYRTTVR